MEATAQLSPRGLNRLVEKSDFHLGAQRTALQQSVVSGQRVGQHAASKAGSLAENCLPQ